MHYSRPNWEARLFQLSPFRGLVAQAFSKSFKIIKPMRTVPFTP